MKKIGFIGCGNISHYHADALLSLGHKITAITNTEDNHRRRTFIDKYEVPHSFDNWKEMLNSGHCDVIWAIPSANAIDEMILELMTFDLPLFIEKPFALSSQKIKEALSLFDSRKSKLWVGYNRRFYPFMTDLKNRISEGRLRSVLVEIPDSAITSSQDQIRRQWFENSSHLIDLLFFLLGPIKLKNKTILKNPDSGLNDSFHTLLETDNGVPVNLDCNWGSPQRFSMKLNIEDETHLLSPIEIYDIYRGMKVEQLPSSQIKTYTPNQIHHEQVPDNGFKPGFLEQAQSFFQNDESTDLKQLLEEALLIEEILKTS